MTGTSLRARVAARRRRNRELGIADAKLRCGRCKIALPPGTRVFLLFGDPTMYCSEGCRDERPELEAKQKASGQ